MKKTFRRKDFTAVFTDENGYFSLTGSIAGANGAIGDKIAEIAPEFAPLERLHLCDTKTGIPMHATENANYRLGKKDFKAAINSLNLSEDEAEQIGLTQDQTEILQWQIENLKEIWRKRAESIYNYIETLPETEHQEEDESFNPEDYEPQIIALAQHLDCQPDDIQEESENYYSGQGMEFIVADDDTANELWDEYLENYIDECILSELPEQYQYYFDREKWKKDAEFDGRGHCLASYDGEEHEQKIGGEWYFIYRV